MLCIQCGGGFGDLVANLLRRLEHASVLLKRQLLIEYQNIVS